MIAHKFYHSDKIILCEYCGQLSEKVLAAGKSDISCPLAPLGVTTVSSASALKVPAAKDSVSVDTSRRKSAGSTSSASCNKPQRLKAMITKLVMDETNKVYFGDVRVREGMSYDISIPLITVEDFCTLTNSSNAPVATNASVLSGNNEQSLQYCLTENVSLLQAIDTHAKKTNYVAEFKLPRDFSDDHLVYSNTGLADLTSCKRKMIFEVKGRNSNDALLIQLLERVTASMNVSHMLLNSIAFGATPEECLVVIMARQLPESRTEDHTKKIHIWQVPYKNVFEYWLKASNVSLRDFVTEDGLLLCSALRTANINPWLCRVHLHDWSQHRVYDVTLPAYFEWPKWKCDDDEENPSKTRKCIGVKVGAPAFAVKVVHSNEAYNREESALELVKPGFFRGSFSCSKTAVDLSTGVEPPALFPCVEDPSPDYWCLTRPDHLDGAGGVLFFIFGDCTAVRSDPNASKIYDDCWSSLQRMHAKGLCHTDVRLANIVKFGDVYEVIDYGEAVACGTDVNLYNFSKDRMSLLPSSVVHVEPSDVPAKWSPSIDVAMLSQALLHQFTTKSQT